MEEIKIFKKKVYHLSKNDIFNMKKLTFRGQSVMRKSFNEDLEYYYKYGKEPYAIYFIAKQQEVIVGWARVSSYFELKPSKRKISCEIMVYVRGKKRRQGIGTSLIERATKFVELYLNGTVYIFKHDSISKSFYEKLKY